jgi:hypothetical protein
VTFVHVYVLGFAGCMALFAISFWPYRTHQEFRENLLVWTLGVVAVSACWPLALIAALVAATDE